MRLSKLLEVLPNAELIYSGGEWDREIENIFTDSRENNPNGLFVCLTGERVDAHTKAEQSRKNGGVAFVVSRAVETDAPQILVKDTREALSLLSQAFYGYPAKKMKIVGITGTNGKTTTAHMLAAILGAAGKNTGVIGTLGAKFAGRETALSLTTPDPMQLQGLFAEMLSCGVEYVIMEVSAHALFYKKVAGITFTACIFTNFTQDHLDFFTDMQAYKSAKIGLFSAECCPLAILNGDDEVGREIGEMRGERKDIKTIYYGMQTPVECFSLCTDENLHGTECMFNLSDELCRVRLCMVGRYNVYNALAAASCAAELGVGMEAIAVGLNGLDGVCGRLQSVGTYRRASIYVDFAHTPDGLAKSLQSLKRYCKGRLICLFGCGGNRDKSKRKIMGEVAAKNADFTVLTSDNPRFEDPLDIIGEIENGHRGFSARYVIVTERKNAIEYALDMLQRDDVLLVAGKGGEQYQEIMGIKYPFNDQDIIEELLKRKGKIPLS